MSLEPKDGLFLKIGPFQVAAYGRVAVRILGTLIAAYLAGRAIGWW
jgi:hypothetical protein